MAKRGPDEMFVLYDGYDIGQEAHELSMVLTAIIESDTHGFGKEWTEAQFTGVKRGVVNYLGMYDDADNSTAEALDEKEGLELPMVLVWAGNVQGRKATGLRPNMSTHARNAGREAMQKTSAQWETSGAVEEGVVLQSLAAESGAGVTSDGSHDHGAAGVRSAVYLQVTELDLGGYDSITVAVQESSNDGAGDAFADIATFTIVTAESFAERIAIAASVEQFTRVTLTLNGTGSVESITLLVAITD